MGLFTSKLANALAVMVLNHSIREWLEGHDPKALEQAINALTAYDPGTYKSKIAEARAIRAHTQTRLPATLAVCEWLEANDPQALNRAIAALAGHDPAISEAWANRAYQTRDGKILR
jgi:hypothetical protein